MTHADALEFLGSAGPWHGRWADAGAGSGTFTRALAELIGPAGIVFAIDRDARALAEIHAPDDAGASETGETSAGVIVARGDIGDLAAIPALRDAELDGVLFANVLHFTREPARVLAQAAQLLPSDGRIVVIEYDRRWPNPWVPHPLPPDRLADAAHRAGLGMPKETARRPSLYHREMYCAVIGR